MQSTEVYRLLGRRHRRGYVIGRIMWNVCFIVMGVIIFVLGSISWTIVVFFVALALYMLWVNNLGMQNSAWRISENPRLVYWAHPTSGHEPYADVPLDECTIMKLHLTDGTEFEVLLPVEQMRAFINWLREQNPELRLGEYRAENERSG
jgi:hypothetical protein